MKPIFTAEVNTVGGRDGHTKSTDGVLDLKLAMPKELGGPGGHATNPEQLFAAGYSACFEGAMGVVARMQGKSVKDASINSRVTLNGLEDKSLKLSVEMKVKVPGLSREETQDIVNKAHEICPYSRAVKGNIDVKFEVV